jgi:hypothetical protein
MKLKLIDIQINSNDDIVVENVEKILVEDLNNEIIGFDFSIKKNIPNDIKIKIELLNNLYHLPLHILNENDSNIILEKKDIDTFVIEAKINIDIFDFKYLIKSNVYSILDVITKELDENFEFITIKSVRLEVLPIDKNDIDFEIDNIFFDLNLKSNEDLISFKKIFNYDFKYIFDEVRFLLLKYLIEDPVGNKKKIEELILSSKDERKYENNLRGFLEKVLENLNYEIKNYGKFKKYYVAIINFIKTKYFNQKVKSNIFFKRSLIKKVNIKDDNYNYISKQNITRNLDVKKNKSNPKNEPKEIKSSYSDLNLIDRNKEEIGDLFTKYYNGWQNEIKTIIGEQFMVTYTIRKNILINPISSIVMVNIFDIENFKDSLFSIFTSKLDYYVELILFSNLIDERLYEFIQNKIVGEDKIIGVKVIYRFNRRNINYNMIQQLLVSVNFCEENSKYINVIRDYSIVPNNWINKTIKHMEINNKCDWLQYKKSNLINQNTGVISLYQIIDTFNMLKKSQAIHVCFKRNIVYGINFMSSFIANIFYLKDLRNYLLERRDIKINFIEKNSKKSLEKLEL